MSDDGEDFGDVGMGLGKVFAEIGIEAEVGDLDALMGKTDDGRGGRVNTAYAAIDDDADAKYMDLSDDEVGEDDEQRRLRQQREMEEARNIQRAMKIQREAEVAAQAAARQAKLDRENGVGLSELDELKRTWPGFEKGAKLRMSEIFYETPGHRRNLGVAFQKKRKLDRERVEYKFKVAPGPEHTPQAEFLQSALASLPSRIPGQPLYQTQLGANFDQLWVKGAKRLRMEDMTRPPEDVDLNALIGFQPAFEEEEEDLEQLERALDLADWEKDIVMCSLDRQEAKRPFTALAPRNDILESGEWLKDVIWDARRLSPGLLEDDEEETTAVAERKGIEGIDKRKTVKLDPFNISNDHLYEQAKEARMRIRQTFGAIEVFHSAPAKALQIPFYKTTLSKAEARSWRRPGLQFPSGIALSFSKLKSNPSGAMSSKKKTMLADPSERFKTTKDLTMSEKGPYVLLEFSEEYPPIMSGYGMGTTIVNYYRKTDDKDEHVPKLDFGQPSILNVGDADPFLLGYVDRGKVTQVIHNNLLRAPIFKHQPETTDFLVVRHTINGHVSYHLRAINNLYTVGQSVPNESEVPGPHARKNTNTAKQRLMIVAWLLIQKSQYRTIELKKLLKYFPDQTELQMRQRLKIKGNEFLIFSRENDDTRGQWVINPEYDFPSNRKEVLERCSPEAAMLYEAMQVGARHLYDAGYTKTAEGKEEDDAGDDSILDIEQQLAVWKTTLNYKKAEAQKAWLIVHGEGEPTGRGEGFSFLKTNMKGYFLRKGETEAGRRLEAEAKATGDVVKISNAAQQQIYEEEKRKVWDLQARALSNPSPPELAPEDELAPPMMTPAGHVPRFDRSGSHRARSRGNSMAATPAWDSPRDRSPSAFSADGESTFTGNANAGKVMRIKRVIKGKTVTEVVRDPAVIRSYLKRVEEKKIAYYMKHPEELQPSGNAIEDELRKQALRLKVEQVKKNQQRRLARKKAERGELDVYAEGDDSGKRKCGACGQIGHTRANRMCPMFNANSVGPSPVGTTPTAQTPGTYGIPFTPIEPSLTPSETTGTTSFKIRLGVGKQ